MPLLTIQLRNSDDAHVADTWRIYHAFLGRYYQRAVDSEAGISMIKDYPDEWTIPISTDDYKEIAYVTLKCHVFNALFAVQVEEL